MPYISKEEREQHDPCINNLFTNLNTMDNDRISGHLNYILFRLAKLLCNEQSGGKHNYARMAVVSSALSEAQAEFRRRIMAPYEDEKIKQNGDIQC